MGEQNQGKSSEEVVNLLLEQKYQEAIPILDALIEEYPSHEEYSVYRSLVLRILIAHWTLSRVNSGHTTSGGAHRLRKSLVGVFQFSRQKLIRSLREIYNNLYRKQPLRIAVLSCAILIMLVGIQEGNNVKNPDPRKTSISRDNPQSTMLSSQTRPLTISTGEAADNDSHPNPLRTGSDETPSSPAISKEADNSTISATRKLRAIPNDQPQNLTASKSKTATAQIAKAPARNGASNKQQPPTVVSRNNESPLASSDEKAKSNNGAGAAIVDEYRSARPIGLRKSPSFAAEAIGEIHTGESLDVKEFTGSWAKVRLKPSGAVGFVRRELLVPITKNDGTAKGQSDESANTANTPAP